MKITLILTNIDYYNLFDKLLVINRTLYIDYIALAIVPSWGEQQLTNDLAYATPT